MVACSYSAAESVCLQYEMMSHTDLVLFWSSFANCLWNHLSDAELTSSFSAALEEAQARSANIHGFSPRARRSRFPHTQPTMLLLHLPPTIPPLVRAAYWALKKSFHTLPRFWIAWLTRSENIIATIWVAPLLNCVRAFTPLLACTLVIHYTYVFMVS